MRFVSVRDLRGKAAKIWRDLPAEKDIVVTSNGRPVAILSAVSGENVVESLEAIRRSRAVEAVAHLQQQSALRGNDRISMGEIEREVRQVRKLRRR